MSFLRAIPTFVLPWIVYHALALLGGAGLHTGPDAILNSEAFRVPLLNGDGWTVSYADCVIALALITGFAEVFKASSVTGAEFVNYGFAAVLFVLFLVEFIALPIAQTSAFFMILLALFCDLFVSFAVGLRTSRRNIGVADRN